MKSIYSTQQDKELSDGEIIESSINIGSEKEYPSDYEGDQFEDEDPDDDFNLPRNHEQIVNPNDQYVNTTIKQKIQENKKSQQAKKAPQYQSTGSQAVLSRSQEMKKPLSSSKKAKKDSQSVEEHKSKIVEKSWLVRNQAQIAQNKDTKKEQKIRDQIKTEVGQLKIVSSRAFVNR